MILYERLRETEAVLKLTNEHLTASKEEIRSLLLSRHSERSEHEVLKQQLEVVVAEKVRLGAPFPAEG